MIGHKTVTEFEDTHPTKSPNYGFIITYLGKKFYFEDPKPDQIDIRDIAHSLSHICRFNGHTNLFYSVAAHSIFVAERMPGSAREKLSALLHDAAEAYVCDVPSPLKPLLGAAHKSLHDDILLTICYEFGCMMPGHTVDLYDKAACVLEAEAFFAMSHKEMEDAGYDMSLKGLWPDWDPSALAQRADDPPNETEERFLAMFEKLTSEISMQESGND